MEASAGRTPASPDRGLRRDAPRSRRGTLSGWLEARAVKAAIRQIEGEELQDGVQELRRGVYPDVPYTRDATWHASVWRWLARHPSGGEMRRWVAMDGERVVGHLAATPQSYRVNGQRIVAHTPADYMVHPEYGFQALSLMRRFFRSTENCVACDMLPAVIAVETRMWAEEAGKLTYRAKLLDVSQLPSPNLEDARKILGRFLNRGSSGAPEEPTEGPRPEMPPPRPRVPLPAPIKGFLNGGLRAADEALGRGFGGSLRVEELDGFDESFDVLFEKIASTVPCLPEKDAAFLNWRYGPGSPQYPVTVLGVKDPGGQLLGYAVLKVSRNEQDGYPLDLTALPGRPDAARALLRETTRYFRRQGVSMIRYRFVDSPTAPRPNDLWKLGFFPRNDRSNSLLVKFADPTMQETARRISNWAYNVGDGEATFWLY